MTDMLPEAAAGTDWMWAALSSRLSLICLAVALVCIAGIALSLRGLLVMRRASRRDGVAAPEPQGGTATIEFCLVFPILLFLMLTLAQTTMVMGGNIIVHYSAFAATRSAVVHIPLDYTDEGGEPHNLLEFSSVSPKLDTIRRAAVFAVLPAAGRAETGGSQSLPVDDFVRGLNAYYAAHGMEAPAWVGNLAAKRLRYADAFTTVEIGIARYTEDDELYFEFLEEGEDHQYGPRDPVAIRVSHRLNLGVPLAGRIFADGSHPAGRYADVQAMYMLNNEGIDTRLPPQPELPRDP